MEVTRRKNCSFRCQLMTGLRVYLATGAAVYLTLWSQEAHAKTPLGKNWSSSQLVSMDRIDHDSFDALLKKYVDADGYVDYKAWKSSSADRRALQSYLGKLGRASTKIRSSREAQIAFWINAYNAVTLEGILQVYPTSSIRNHTARLIGYNIWTELPLRVGGKTYSLEDMEHKILRRKQEPRVHFAIVCASVGCPRLKNEAYTPEKLEQQLQENTLDFFSRSQNLRVDSGSRTIYFSSILKWFSDDFGNSQADRLGYLKPYLPTAAQQLAGNSRTRVKYLDYNWNLNDQLKKPRTASRR
jgi:hypothetical protein